ncbi:hypothetical protein AK812_SmicGene25255 [Symbiodinium microadriaticum]|uniref:C3H1-type domain-containing protein n=1 Tax=Symbiodinium microadriaticum TaxID=2951 RepID=A0A1Q9DCI8_SYMMI|nr:hypothetical protein AK812_SmicGene25255 [Symbiodinium microadriaticum]
MGTSRGGAKAKSAAKPAEGPFAELRETCRDLSDAMPSLPPALRSALAFAVPLVAVLLTFNKLPAMRIENGSVDSCDPVRTYGEITQSGMRSVVQLAALRGGVFLDIGSGNGAFVLWAAAKPPEERAEAPAVAAAARCAFVKTPGRLRPCVPGDKLLPFLLKFRDVVERPSHHLMLERLVAVSEVTCALARKAERDEQAPDWTLTVQKIDVRGAINIWFSLLTAERLVVNLGEIDTRKIGICARCKSALGVQGADENGRPNADAAAGSLLAALEQFRLANALEEAERQVPDTTPTDAAPRGQKRRRGADQRAVSSSSAPLLIMSSDMTEPCTFVKRSGQESFPSFRLKKAGNWPESTFLTAVRHFWLPGSGLTVASSGRVSAVKSAGGGYNESRGVEVMLARHQQALAKVSEAAPRRGHVDLIHGDVLHHLTLLSDAHLVYWNNLCFSAAESRLVVEAFTQRAPRGATLVTLAELEMQAAVPIGVGMIHFKWSGARKAMCRSCTPASEATNQHPSAPQLRAFRNGELDLQIPLGLVHSAGKLTEPPLHGPVMEVCAQPVQPHRHLTNVAAYLADLSAQADNLVSLLHEIQQTDRQTESGHGYHSLVPPNRLFLSSQGDNRPGSFRPFHQTGSGALDSSVALAGAPPGQFLQSPQAESSATGLRHLQQTDPPSGSGAPGSDFANARSFPDHAFQCAGANFRPGPPLAPGRWLTPQGGELSASTGQPADYACGANDTGIECSGYATQPAVQVATHANSSRDAGCTEQKLQEISEPKVPAPPARSKGSHELGLCERYNVGSLGHPELCRKPCLFHERGECENGAACGYCHFQHLRRPAVPDRCQRSLIRRLSLPQLIVFVVPHVRTRASKAGLTAAMSVVIELLETTLANSNLFINNDVMQQFESARMDNLLERMNIMSLLCLVMNNAHDPKFASQLEAEIKEVRAECGFRSLEVKTGSSRPGM